MKSSFNEFNKAEKHNWADKSKNQDPTKKLDESITTYYDDLAKKWENKSKELEV